MTFEGQFVVGRTWHKPHGKVAIPIHTIEMIIFDAGNQPPADRVLRLNNLAHIDLLVEPGT